MNAFIFAQACEEYEMGLTVMLRAARCKFTLIFHSLFLNYSSLAETNPTKIKILRDVVIIYYSILVF
jgi:hypothetical protein